MAKLTRKNVSLFFSWTTNMGSKNLSLKTMVSPYSLLNFPSSFDKDSSIFPGTRWRCYLYLFSSMATVHYYIQPKKPNLKYRKNPLNWWGRFWLLSHWLMVSPKILLVNGCLEGRKTSNNCTSLRASNVGCCIKWWVMDQGMISRWNNQINFKPNLDVSLNVGS